MPGRCAVAARPGGASGGCLPAGGASIRSRPRSTAKGSWGSGRAVVRGRRIEAGRDGPGTERTGPVRGSAGSPSPVGRYGKPPRKPGSSGHLTCWDVILVWASKNVTEGSAPLLTWADAAQQGALLCTLDVVEED
ncbi:hypothetical protein FRAHR75_480029 [Frankia sp. Hr75.2]|nr:hypothetical protein FRAHR75_480029 [Frankia sp. Hr75.2]